MNTTAIKELVDTALYSKVVQLFNGRPMLGGWLIHTEGTIGTRWKELSVKDVIRLMDTSENRAEIRAIALFSYTCGMHDKRFIQRLVELVAEEPDAILEMVLLKGPYCTPTLRNKLIDSLKNVRRERCIEQLITLEALFDERSESEIFTKTGIVGGMLQQLDPIRDAGIFAECIRVAMRIGIESYNCSATMQCLYKTVMNVPSYRGGGYGELAYWGINLLDQLKICYAVGSVLKLKGSVMQSNNKEKRLHSALAYELFNLNRQWTEDEKILAMIVKDPPRTYQGWREEPKEKFFVANEDNVFPGCLVRLEYKISLARLSDKEAATVVKNSLKELSDRKLQQAFKENEEEIRRALSANTRDSFGVYCMLVDGGCIEASEYEGLRQRQLRNWSSKESLDWVCKNGMTGEMLSGLCDKGGKIKETLAESEFIDLENMVVEKCVLEYPWLACSLSAHFNFSDEEKLWKILFPDSNQELSEEVKRLPFPLRVAIARNADWESTLCSVYETEGEDVVELFWYLVGEKVEAVSPEELCKMMTGLNCKVVACFLYHGIGYEEAENFPQFIRNGDDCTLREDKLFDTDWVKDFNETPYNWKMHTEQEKEFLIEFGGRLPARYVNEMDEIRELRKKSEKHFDEVCQWILSGVKVSDFHSVEKFDGLKKRLFGNLAVLVDADVDVENVLALREQYPEEAKSLTLKKLPENSVMRGNMLYTRCNFSGISLNTLAKVTGQGIKAKVNKSTFKLLEDHRWEIVDLATETGKTLKQLAWVEKRVDKIVNVKHLAFNILRGNEKRLQEVFGVDDEMKVRAASYWYNWDKYALEHIDSVQKYSIHWSGQAGVRQVLQGEYRLRKLLNDYNLSEITLERLISFVENPKLLKLVGNTSDTMYNAEIAGKMMCSVILEILTDSFKLPKLGKDIFGGISKELKEQAERGSLSPVSAAEWLEYVVKDKQARGEKRVIAFLNLLDGSWFEQKEELYRLMWNNEEVVAVLIARKQGEVKEIPCLAGSYRLGVTNAPVKISNAGEPMFE